MSRNKKLWSYQGKEYTINDICRIANISERNFYKWIREGLTPSEIVNNKPDRRYKHGMSHTKLDFTYCNMIRRCYNPKSQYYIYYGARGIGVCDEWRNDRKTFFEWALNNGYNDTLTIDRIDNNKGYSPSNCRWVSQSIQNENTRKSIRLLYSGKWRTIGDIMRIENIPYITAYMRYVVRDKTKLPIKHLYEKGDNNES